jgi:hypothetical protein
MGWERIETSRTWSRSLLVCSMCHRTSWLPNVCSCVRPGSTVIFPARVRSKPGSLPSRSPRPCCRQGLHPGDEKEARPCDATPVPIPQEEEMNLRTLRRGATQNPRLMDTSHGMLSHTGLWNPCGCLCRGGQVWRRSGLFFLDPLRSTFDAASLLQDPSPPGSVGGKPRGESRRTTPQAWKGHQGQQLGTASVRF